MIAKLDDADESMVTVELIFAEVNQDPVPIVEESEIMKFDSRVRTNYQMLINQRSVQFLLQFDEVEDFVLEIRNCFVESGRQNCDLLVQ